jgi:transcriptional regulator with XRE-family HTH domain
MEKNISTTLREIKVKTRWSEPIIATKIGVSQPTVNRILKGQADCMGRTRLAILDLYKVVCNSQM